MAQRRNWTTGYLHFEVESGLIQMEQLMNRRMVRLMLFLAGIAMIFGQPTNSFAFGGPSLKAQLAAAIAGVQRGKPSRAGQAEHMADVAKHIDPELVDDQMLLQMEALLETRDDAVRAWVAASLGNLGPRAKRTIPSLLKILPEVDCQPMGLTSAPFIRAAIARMGEKPPPRPECRTLHKRG